MKLSDREKSLLQGDFGSAARKSMEILVALAKIYGAETFYPVSSVQVSGVSYHNLNEAGLEWLEEMAKDGHALVMTSLNPAGMDLDRWQEQGVDPCFAEKQLRIIEAYKKMGILASCTCTPYLIGNIPVPGEHIAWAESSAVTFANSVLSARTNREGGPSALASALTGITPAYGLHLDENRAPTLELVVETKQTEGAGTPWWGALGRVVGEMSVGQVVLLRGVPRAELPELKTFCASVVTFGGNPLVHIEGVTTEYLRFDQPKDSAKISRNLLFEAFEYLNDSFDESVDLVCLGCPHASIQELCQIANILDGKKVRIPTWICTARSTWINANELGVVETIEKSGAKVVRDTCFVVAPIKGWAERVATNSAKGCFYARGHNKLSVRFGSTSTCLQAAISGRWS